VSVFVEIVQWVFLIYFVAINFGYFSLNLLAIYSLRKSVAGRALSNLPQTYSGIEPAISILVPAYNEEATITTSVRSLLQVDYPEFEVVVVNDGSRDGTLAALIRDFDLKPFPEVFWAQLNTQPVRAMYRSSKYLNLRVVDKENGGKADALNVGISTAKFPLFCAIDADSILQRDSLRRVIEPFLEDPYAIASGGTVRIANGCEVRGGFLTKINLPNHPLAMLQIVEYLRAFLFGRLGWAAINAVLIISGAFGVFKKDAVIKAGGYTSGSLGEDMELVVRMHRLFREKKQRYSIHFIADPICWTEAPESLKVLKSQRVRWQRGLAESLYAHRSLCFSKHGGTPGWVAFPFMTIFEWWGPLLEVAGYASMIYLMLVGHISFEVFLIFMAMAFTLGFMLSLSALLLEELTFHLYPRFGQIGRLLLAAIMENFGFRQLVSVWRLIGLVKWMVGAKASWGNMTRSGTWQNSGTK
jgi:cellulose synthase/poly-beta-1,6-N-acetylglucosamine synthase-like glycosyltransferase